MHHEISNEEKDYQRIIKYLYTDIILSKEMVDKMLYDLAEISVRREEDKKSIK